MMLRWFILTVALSLASAPAWAQTESEKEEARALFKAGVEARKTGDLQLAFDKYDKAFGLVKHYQIAANLGAVELELAKHTEAADHLWFAYTQMQQQGIDKTDDGNEVKARYDEALTKVARVNLSATFQGQPIDVERMVDSIVVPSGDAPLFLSAGYHNLLARAAGLGGSVSLDAVAGQTHDVDVKLWVSADTYPVAGPGSSALSNGSGGDASAGSPAWPLYVGYAVAGAGFVMAAVSGAQLVSKSEAANASTAAVLNASGFQPEIACSPPTTVLLSDCNAWRDAESASTDWTTTLVASLAAGGSATFATITYHLLRDGDASDGVGRGASEVRHAGNGAAIEPDVAIAASPHGVSVTLVGAF